MHRRSAHFNPAFARDAFTLIELLVVISIIGLLVAILLPVLSRAKEQSQRVRCLSNQRQVAIGVNAYAIDFKGSTPLRGVWLDPANPEYSLGIEVTYAIPSSPVERKFYGVGLLWSNHYVNDFRVFYCPVDRYVTKLWYPGYADNQWAQPPWFDGFIPISYQYRPSSTLPNGTVTYAVWNMNATNAGGRAILGDFWIYGLFNYNHGDIVQAVYLDGSGRGISNDQGFLTYAAATGGSVNTDWYTQEVGWRTYVDR